MEHVEIVVIGAGVIGLAIARQLAQLGKEVLIVEAETSIGSVNSSRNSGVIHAGIYYPVGSLKARSCIAGRDALYRYANERQIPHRQCGKLIVAVDDSQIANLRDIRKRAEDNGVQDLSWLTRDEVRDYEAELSAVAGLRSPMTGIIDVHELMLSLLGDAEARGAVLSLNSPVVDVAIGNGEFLVRVAGASPVELSCRYLVNAAGLGAQRIARRMTGLDPATVPSQAFAKGSYFTISGKQPFKTLVYPVPASGGLGVHATLDMAGRVRFGPDVEWVSTIDFTIDLTRAALFREAIRRYWPNVEFKALQPDYAGIRPKICTEGAPDADFMVQGANDHNVPRLVNLYGIESPGLTSSLPLAEHVSHMLL